MLITIDNLFETRLGNIINKDNRIFPIKIDPSRNIMRKLHNLLNRSCFFYIVVLSIISCLLKSSSTLWRVFYVLSCNTLDCHVRKCLLCHCQHNWASKSIHKEKLSPRLPYHLLIVPLDHIHLYPSKKHLG